MDYPSSLEHGDQQHEQLVTQATQDELVMQHQGTPPQHVTSVPDKTS